MLEWHLLYEQVLPYIVRIETPEGFGTGFLFAFNQKKTVAGFATAAHVVQHADSWKLPIKITHHVSGEELFLTTEDRFIEVDEARDSASILVKNVGSSLPDNPLAMMEPTHFKKVGVEVAWAGYPVIARPHLCLFTGSIATFLAYDDSYLIDGVAIHGVSGGPVFAGVPGDDDTPELLGTISMYMPNRQPSDTLPGMLRAHDLTAFAETIKWIKSLDEAKEKKEKEDQEKRQAEAAGTAEPAPVSTPPQEPTPAKPAA